MRTSAEPAVPGDLRMMGRLWPVLLASVVGLLPFTVFSTFLVAIAADAGHSVAAVGGLRGLGGLTALAVGVGFAPVLGRVSRWQAAAAGLLLLGVAAVFGVVGGVGPLAVFCAATGAATAVLNPALAVAAADRFGAGPASGQAATLVTATQSLAAVLAAPVVALPSLWWGWQGTLAAVAVLAAALALLLLREGRRVGASAGADDAGPAGYLASLRAVARVPGAPVLLGVSLLRTAAFMGYLAYLAGLYGNRFGLTSTAFAAVWTVSGASFFVGNLLVGRAVNATEPKVPPERALLAGAAVAAVAAVSMVAVYHVPLLPLALAATAVLGLSHATVAACVVSLLVRRCGASRGAALSLNAAGMSLGVFTGAALGGAGLALAGYSGIAAALGGLTALAVLGAWLTSRSASR